MRVPMWVRHSYARWRERDAQTFFPLDEKFYRFGPERTTMETDMSEDVIRLRSGREVCATNCILGISPTLDITQGLDEHITMMPDEISDEPDWGGLAPDEVTELCDIALDRWHRLKALVSGV